MVAADHGAGLWHPRFVKEGRNSREVDPRRGLRARKPDHWEGKCPERGEYFSVKKPTIGETHVQAKKAKVCIYASTRYRPAGSSLNHPSPGVQDCSESVCWVGVSIPNNFLMDMEMGFPQFLGFTASE